MRFIDNLNFLVHEIRIFLVVSVIWALVADNDTLSYSSMYDIPNKINSTSPNYVIPQRHRNKKKNITVLVEQ